MDAYDDMIRHTATRHAPWFVVPADHKWYTRLVVASAIITTLENLALEFPTVPPAERARMAAARADLLREKR